MWPQIPIAFASPDSGREPKPGHPQSEPQQAKPITERPKVPDYYFYFDL